MNRAYIPRENCPLPHWYEISYEMFAPGTGVRNGLSPWASCRHINHIMPDVILFAFKLIREQELSFRSTKL